jgi:hypothetical protein
MTTMLDTTLFSDALIRSSMGTGAMFLPPAVTI